MAATVLTPRRITPPERDDVVWAPYPGPQTALVTCPIEDILFGGSRGGGKTDGLAGDYLAHWWRHRSHARGIIFRRTYDELDEVHGRLMEIFPRLGAEWLAGRRTWRMPGGGPAGGFLKLRHLKRDEDASKYQGHSYTWQGFDEAGNFPTADPIDRLRATLRSKHGVRCVQRLTANPGGPGHQWLKARYIDTAPPMVPWVDPTSGVTRIFIPSTIEDNPSLRDDPAYIRSLKASGPAWLVQAWLAGDWNATPEGGVIKSAWFRRYRTIPADVYLIQSWDTAQKPGQLNDYSVCTTWAVSRLGYFLVDVFRRRLDFPGLKAAAVQQAAFHRPTSILIEDKASGTSLIQELRSSTTLSIIPREPTGEGDKVFRMEAAATQFESGRVFFPEQAPWLLDYEIELTIFPLAAYDDQVDSTSQFLNWAAPQSAAGPWIHASRGRRASHDTPGA